MKSGHRLVTWLLIAGLAGVAGASTFSSWVQAYGGSHNMHLDRRWQQPLAPGGRPFMIARLCEGEDKQGFTAEHIAYLLDDQQARRWVITFQQEDRVYCGSGHLNYYGHLRRHGASAGDLLLHDVIANHQQLQFAIGMRGGEPVVVGQSEWLAEGARLKGPFFEDDTLEDWDELVLRQRRARLDLDGKLVFDRRAAIIPVVPEPAARPPLTQRIRGPWDGEKDASLRVSAKPAPDGRVHLHIELSDDIQVLASEDATNAELSRADHVQLWHCFSEERRRPFGCSKMHSLLLAFTRTGRWIVRGDAADPQLRPPMVSGTATTADVILDIGAGSDGGRAGWRRHFTVVYSDVDGPFAPALLGTSLVDPKDSDSLGLLVAQPDYQRYPAIGSSTQTTMSVKAL